MIYPILLKAYIFKDMMALAGDGPNPSGRRPSAACGPSTARACSRAVRASNDVPIQPLFGHPTLQPTNPMSEPVPSQGDGRPLHARESHTHHPPFAERRAERTPRLRTADASEAGWISGTPVKTRRSRTVARAIY